MQDSFHILFSFSFTVFCNQFLFCYALMKLLIFFSLVFRFFYNQSIFCCVLMKFDFFPGLEAARSSVMGVQRAAPQVAAGTVRREKGQGQGHVGTRSDAHVQGHQSPTSMKPVAFMTCVCVCVFFLSFFYHLYYYCYFL